MTHPIILLTINARYAHTAFALRCLRANMGNLREHTHILEYDLRADPRTMAREVMALRPFLLGLGIYIWNTEICQTLLHELRKQPPPRPITVLGGPEAAHLPGDHPLATLADHIIEGEGERVFPELCRRLISTPRRSHHREHLRAPPPDLATLRLPYDEYRDHDLRTRITYVESARGCPHRCAYCLSALESSIRYFPLPPLLDAWERLLQRGVRRFRFLDRSFNANEKHACQVLEFFARHNLPDLRLHLEFTPAHPGGNLARLLCRFPPHALHIEIGVQTYDPESSARLGRTWPPGQIDQTLRFLIEKAGAAVHADLIAGLPGETLEMLAAHFDRLYALRPREIQIGLLKCLRGTPLETMSRSWSMHYAARPPYEVLATAHMPAPVLDRIKRAARYWELLHNRGSYQRTSRLVMSAHPSPFHALLRWSDHLHEQTGTTHGIPMIDMMQHLFNYLTTHAACPPPLAAQTLLADYADHPGHIKPPRFLTRHTPANQQPA